MTAPWVLIVLALNFSYDNPGTGSFSDPAPTVTMQEFDSKGACLFAREVILRRAGEMKKRLDVVCVPKGDS